MIVAAPRVRASGRGLRVEIAGGGRAARLVGGSRRGQVARGPEVDRETVRAGRCGRVSELAGGAAGDRRRRRGLGRGELELHVDIDRLQRCRRLARGRGLVGDSGRLAVAVGGGCDGAGGGRGQRRATASHALHESIAYTIERSVLGSGSRNFASSSGSVAPSMSASISC